MPEQPRQPPALLHARPALRARPIKHSASGRENALRQTKKRLQTIEGPTYESPRFAIEPIKRYAKALPVGPRLSSRTTYLAFWLATAWASAF